MGPLALVGARRYTTASVVRRFGGNKFPLLVRAGRRATIAVASPGAALHYGATRGDRRVMAFVGCGAGRDAGFDPDKEPVSF